MTRIEFLEIIKKSENPFHNEFSFKNGSDYYSVDSVVIRVSDHAKPTGSFGYETYKEGVNDFRNYEDALSYLSSKLDMADKTFARADFYKSKSGQVQITKEGYYKTPYGMMFASLDSALNNWWCTKIDFN
ncbi:hypothetical protein V2E39_22835 [Chryseobacterium arthrosphaerae]|uniref:Uncharacterized protein n=1 Tax=Chryseobacterium arthrosphaerae TaxID=651561 RepID=A0ABU7R625_9FLAO